MGTPGHVQEAKDCRQGFAHASAACRLVRTAGRNYRRHHLLCKRQGAARPTPGDPPRGNPPYRASQRLGGLGVPEVSARSNRRSGLPPERLRPQRSQYQSVTVLPCAPTRGPRTSTRIGPPHFGHRLRCDHRAACRGDGIFRLRHPIGCLARARVGRIGRAWLRGRPTPDA
jgi:hypothetical protein